MTNPTLEQYIEGVDKEFDEKADKFNVEPDDGELIKSFLKSSIQGAWDKAEKKGFEEAVELLAQLKDVGVTTIKKILSQLRSKCPNCEVKGKYLTMTTNNTCPVCGKELKK